MYSRRTGLTLAFHGCDQSLVTPILNGSTFLKKSTNKYDWLGHGIYFWERSPSRAFEFAEFLSRTKKRIKHPAVIGAVVDLGYCLDLLDYPRLSFLKDAYNFLVISSEAAGMALPVNKMAADGNDLLYRELDCTVIESLHKLRMEKGLPPFDSIRSAFWEGKELYPSAGIREKNHIQICIRNPNCIKGFFRERQGDPKYIMV